MKCHFCTSNAIAIFELKSENGYTWEVPLCLEDALLMQTQGYSLKVKKVERNEETKRKEKEEKV
jgi:hypothetical protein